MPASTIFILSTQNLPEALVKFAAEAGIQLDTEPFIRTESLEVKDIPQEPVAAVFTSRHAVEALDRVYPGWTIFCIEGPTRRRVEERFGRETVAGAANSATALAQLIVASGVDKRIVFFCGDNRLDELPFRLRTAGIQVEERIVYRTVPTPKRLLRTYSGIAFFSPSGAESFFSANPVGEDTVFFAIGHTTAAAVAAKTGTTPVIASRADKETLIREMIAHFTI